MNNRIVSEIIGEVVLSCCLFLRKDRKGVQESCLVHKESYLMFFFCIVSARFVIIPLCRIHCRLLNTRLLAQFDNEVNYGTI